jgi:hypothetical protein
MARKTARTTTAAMGVVPLGTDIVTNEDLDAAEQNVLDAAEALAEAEAKTGARWIPGRAGVLQEADWRHRHAVRHLAQLKEARAAQEAVLGSRKPAEEAAAEAITNLSGRMKASTSRTVAAIVAAEEAMAAAVAAVDEHDALISSASAELGSLGLLATDAFGEHATGGTERHTAVRLGGDWWTSLGARAVFVRSVSVVARSLWGDHDQLAGWRYSHEVQALTRRGSRVIDALPARKSAARRHASPKAAAVFGATAFYIDPTTRRDVVKLPNGTVMDAWEYKAMVANEREADTRTLKDLTHGPMMDDPMPR